MAGRFLHNKEDGKRERERIFNMPPVILCLFLICCAAYGVPAYILSAGQSEVFYALFGFVPVLFLHNHDIMTQLSAITYSFLHGSFTHLGLNMLWFIIFGTPLANRLGGVFFVVFWFFTAFIAALVYCMANPGSESSLIGASGAIAAMMGAAARYNFQAVSGSFPAGGIMSVRAALASRAVLVALGSFILLNLLTAADQWSLGFAAKDTSIAWEAHLGGLVAGFLTVGQFDKWAHKFDRRG